MKKVLFFVESLHCGGAEKSLLSLLNNMDYTNYEVELMVLKKGGEFEKFVPSHIPITSIEYHVNTLERTKFKFLRLTNHNRHHAQLFWKSIGKNISAHDKKYDIAISWGQGFATYYVSQKVNATKKYAWVNIDYEKAGYDWKTDLYIYKEFDTVVGVSEFVKESMQKFLPEEKVISIRNIIDPDEIRSKGKLSKSITFNKNSVSIVSVGRLAKQKGFELAIRAIKILKENNLKIHLYIIGEGQERNFLENEIKTLGVEEECTLLGFRENPYPYINDCDMYLQSSWFEGLGRTIIEAGLLCKPIVTTNFPTASSILTDRITGIITEMNPEKIANSLKELIIDNELKNLLINNLEKQEDKEKDKTLTAVYKLLDS